MTLSYDFFTSDSRPTTVDGTGKSIWEGYPGTSLWLGPTEYYWERPHKPITPGIPVIRRTPKKDRWKKYVKDWKKIKKIKDIAEVTRHVEIRPVIICGWCGARIPRGMEDEPCEYCGS